MVTETKNGFTIIETMLFLAIAGALTIAIMVGSGTAINQQRYRDSVNTLKAFIQQQYSEVSNVSNARLGSEACSNAAVNQSAGGGAQPRGTSNCVLLGRYITIDDTGKTITASSVVGQRTNTGPEEASDIAEIQTNYQLGVSPVNRESQEIDWGATVVRQDTTNPMPLSMLIMRSPLSGSIMTFSQEGVTSNLLSLVTAGNSSAVRDLCVDSASGSGGGRRASVRISAFATNPGAIQIPPESTSVCD